MRVAFDLHIFSSRSIESSVPYQRRGRREGGDWERTKDRKYLGVLSPSFPILIMSNSHNPTPVITLITGASRGLGLEFATQLLDCSPSNFVICAARNPSSSDGLMALLENQKWEGRVECVQMDVGDTDSVEVSRDRA